MLFSMSDGLTFNPIVAYAIMAAAVVLAAGAALAWGDARLLGDDGVPVERVFTGLAAVGALVGAILAWREHRRMIGAGISLGAGIIALVILYFYAAEAGLGPGYFVAMLAAVPLTAAAALGLTKRGITPTEGPRSR